MAFTRTACLVSGAVALVLSTVSSAPCCILTPPHFYFILFANVGSELDNTMPLCVSGLWSLCYTLVSDVGATAISLLSTV